MNRLYTNSFLVAGIFAFILCLYLSFGFSRNTSDKPVVLESKINPNVASAANLMRLPSIGISKASAIIEYRKQFEKNNPGDLAFKDCGDLDNVKGIGPATVNSLCPWLKFK